MCMSRQTIKNLTILFVVITLAIPLITSSSLPFSGGNNNTIVSVYAFVNDNDGNKTNTSSNATGLNSSSSEMYVRSANIDTKKIRIGDIDIAYKIFGKGDPLLFISGFSMAMDMWEPMLNGLPENHTIILFDNRGIGQTTAAGNETTTSAGTLFTIDQFTNDTAALIDALKIRQPVDVLGLSLGGFIAQEIALSHPEKVNRLILVSSQLRW